MTDVTIHPADPAAVGEPHLPPGPEGVVAELRARLQSGQRLSPGAWSEFNRAIHAIDPTATEDVLAPLVGSGSSHLYGGLIAWAPLAPGERVLDVGCGSGGATRVAAIVSGPQGRVVGIDPCREAIEVARSRPSEGAPITYRIGVAEHLTGIEDRSFDCVVASLMFDEVTDMSLALREIARVLRPGGRLVASTMAFDVLRTQDAGLMGAVVSVVARHAPAALAGKASRASIPNEPADAAAFKDAGLLVPEERDLSFSVQLDTVDDAMAFFGRSKIGYLLDEEGLKALRTTLERRIPHALALPIRFMRTRRPG